MIFTIQKEEHPHFLSEKRRDPVTGDRIKEGDRVVFCASCRSAFTKETWDYMGGEHCGQDKTLSHFPAQASESKRGEKDDLLLVTLSAAGLDLFILMAFVVTADLFILNTFSEPLSGLTGVLFLMIWVFRDLPFGRSFGKKVFALHIRQHKGKKASFLRLAVRAALFPMLFSLSFIYAGISPGSHDLIFMLKVLPVLWLCANVFSVTSKGKTLEALLTGTEPVQEQKGMKPFRLRA